MFTPTPPTDLAPQGHGVGAVTRRLGKRTWASGGQTPNTGEAQDREGQMGLSPPNKTECWGADHEAGRMGPLMGKWGLSPRFLLFFFSLPFFHTQKPIFQTPFSPSSHLSLSYTHVQLFCFSEPHLPPPTFPSSPPHLYALESAETPALPNQRCQKWGHDWTEDMGHAPRASPPCPSRRLYYLIRSSS